MFRFYAELIKDRKLIIDSNLKSRICDKYTIYSPEEIIFNDPDIESYMKKTHGIAIHADSYKIEVINDPFSSIPIYFFCHDGRFVITSKFEDFRGFNLTIDTAGCYENLMYASGLFDRTIFSEIKQMPAASKAVYNIETEDLEVKAYWDFNIRCERNINANEAEKKVWSVLSDIFKKYDSQKLIMGVSGGMDSRLSLCMIKECLNVDNVRTFTFGYDKRILDYKLAVKTCDMLRVRKPRFIRLTAESYKKSRSIPIKSGADIGINHSHLYWCLQQMNCKNKTLVCNYYSDGVMGYDCRPSDAKTIKDSDYYKIWKDNFWNAPKDILEIIKSDLDKVTLRRAKNDNFSGYNEYIYLTERNPKFHIKLSYLFSELISVVCPFADYKLLDAVISLPMEYRYYKKIEHMIIEKRLGKYEDISSTRYGGWDKEDENICKRVKYNLGFIRMRGLNRINSALNMISNGRVQILNKYLTENLLAVFDSNFGDEKHMSDNVLQEKLSLNIKNNPLRKNNLRTADAVRGFSMIGLADVLQYYIP